MKKIFIFIAMLFFVGCVETAELNNSAENTTTAENTDAPINNDDDNFIPEFPKYLDAFPENICYEWILHNTEWYFSGKYYYNLIYTIDITPGNIQEYFIYPEKNNGIITYHYYDDNYKKDVKNFFDADFSISQLNNYDYSIKGERNGENIELLFHNGGKSGDIFYINGEMYYGGFRNVRKF